LFLLLLSILISNLKKFEILKEKSKLQNGPTV